MSPTKRNAMAHEEAKPGDKSVHSFRRDFPPPPAGHWLVDSLEAATNWNDDNAQRLSASVAFYTLLSMAPLLVVVVAVAAVVFGRQAAEGQLAWEIQGMVGQVQARGDRGRDSRRLKTRGRLDRDLI